MGVARVAAELRGTAADVERLWADPHRWDAFVDGFARVVELDDAWPAPGARLVWASIPGDRGRVVERVLRREPGAELVVEVDDPQLRGVQRLALAPREQGGVTVALELDYALARRGPLTLLADPLFVRRALRDSMARTLAGLAGQLGR